jgi:cardiolipin synthase A/B
MPGRHGRGKWDGTPPFRKGCTAGNLLGMSGKTVRHRVTAHAVTPAPPAPPALPAGQGTSFARALWRVASADVSAGNTVTLFDDGMKTFDAMIAMIEHARDSVVLESYILRGDSVGVRFAVALGEAVQRGVHVRVLGDWIGSRGTPASFHTALRRSGVELRIFNRPGWRRWLGLVPRDHRKLLVADGTIGLTGGIGIGEQWQTGILHKRRSPWRDTCVRIAGPAAADMARAFEGMWRRTAGERPPRAKRRLTRAPKGGDLDPATDAPSVVGIVEGEPGRLRIGRALHIQAAAAQRSIWLAGAYFVPSFAETEALAGAARDGVDVRILVPSKYDHPWIRRFATRFYNRLLRNGVRIWEWRGEMMHAKSTVVDGQWVRVGSTDFNPFGVVINFELDALIEDATIGTLAEEMFLRDLTQSTEIRRKRSRWT